MVSYNDAGKTLSILKNFMLSTEKENSKFFFLISSGIKHKTFFTSKGLNRS